MREAQILAEVMVEIGAIEGVLAWRNNTGMARAGDGRIVRFGMPGSPDVIVIAGGRFVGLEVKTERGRQSSAQKRWQQACEAAGGVYAVVRSSREAWLVVMDALHGDDLTSV